MKPDIHPDYVLSTVHCSCGNEFVTRGTQGEIRVELCNECHPFYTGKQKLVDTGGRVERYKQRYAKSLKQRSDSDQEKAQAKQADQAKKSGAGQKA